MSRRHVSGLLVLDTVTELYVNSQFRQVKQWFLRRMCLQKMQIPAPVLDKMTTLVIVLFLGF